MGREILTPGNATGTRMSSADATRGTERATSAARRERSSLVRYTIYGAGGAVVAGTLLTLAACGRGTLSNEGSASATPTSTNSPDRHNPTPGAVPPPDACTIISDTTESCLLNNEKFEVPVLPGLQVQEGTDANGVKAILYVATAGNPYKDAQGHAIKEGTILGEFTDKVDTTDAKGTEVKGGLRFEAPVVSKLLADARAKDPHKLITTFAFDAGDATVDISVMQAAGSGPAATYVRADITGQVAIVNAWTGTDKVHINGGSHFVDSANRNRLGSDKCATTVCNPADSNYVDQYFSDGIVDANGHLYTGTKDVPAQFGQATGYFASGRTGLIEQASTSSRVSVDLSNILNVNGVPVFIMATPAA